MKLSATASLIASLAIISQLGLVTASKTRSPSQPVTTKEYRQTKAQPGEIQESERESSEPEIRRSYSEVLSHQPFLVETESPQQGEEGENVSAGEGDSEIESEGDVEREAERLVSETEGTEEPKEESSASSVGSDTGILLTAYKGVSQTDDLIVTSDPTTEGLIQSLREVGTKISERVEEETTEATEQHAADEGGSQSEEGLETSNVTEQEATEPIGSEGNSEEEETRSNVEETEAQLEETRVGAQDIEQISEEAHSRAEELSSPEEELKEVPEEEPEEVPEISEEPLEEIASEPDEPSGSGEESD